MLKALFYFFLALILFGIVGTIDYRTEVQQQSYSEGK